MLGFPDKEDMGNENSSQTNSPSYINPFKKENEKPLLSMHIAVSLFDNGYIEQCYKILKKSLSLYKEPIIDTWPYLALCCIELHRNEEFLYFLKEAVEKAPLQTQQLLKDLFPVGTEVDEYYDYMYNKINNKL